MNCDIFIRTYKNDIPWLQHLLKSIQAYANGFSNIVICVPSASSHYLQQELKLNTSTFATTYIVPDYENDYLGQQVTKMHADLFCRSEFVLFIDSDCVFTSKVTPDMFVDEKGRPNILRSPYDAIGNDLKWKAITEKALGWTPEYEYMRRHPLVYRRGDLPAFRQWFQDNRHEVLEKYILRQPGVDFSEFNAIGAWLDKFHSARYNFIDTHEKVIEEKDVKRGKTGIQHVSTITYKDLPLPVNHVKQYWSWGGLTPEILAEMEAVGV